MINQIKVINYKNYAAGQASFVPKLNFITGLNGSGKTNLLDALYYICVTKSLHTARDRHIVRFDQPFFRIEALLQRGDSEHEVVAKVQPSKVKEFSVNNTPLDRLSDHLGFQPVIVLTPGDQVMIEGASVERRRFMDFYLCQTNQEYLAALITYNKLLHQRNAHLKERGYRADKILVLSYSEKMAPHAALVGSIRDRFAKDLEPHLNALTGELSDHNDDVHLTYKPDVDPADLLRIHEGKIEDDLRLGRTTSGVHRDDILFSLRDIPMKTFGSQGQRKSFLLALHLALYSYLMDHVENPPVILLDDIFDKLDDQRITALLSILGREDYGQVFITDARPERVTEAAKGLECETAIFTISEGVVRRE